MDLSHVDELSVTQEAPDRVRLRWRHRSTWDSFLFIDDDGYADDEDVLFWLLKQSAPLDLVRTALALPYPDFDVDAVLAHVTMPDRAERRAEDVARRAAAKAEFKRSRAGDAKHE